ncbi:hypothetical protein CEP52_017386 [Fusarium oligoseptatum]|uniref:Cytochrome P450 monooxygenase n=2 Tax=Fusarium solani species complex TaxID=232080 RepID=A0A428RSA9_9HYPO|nr:hypothetical protein CEP52_017386 [Fusarium oligoseptatum]
MDSLSWEVKSSLKALGKPLPLIITILLLFVAFKAYRPASSNAPLLNPRKAHELSDGRLKAGFMVNGHHMVADWFKKNPERPMRLISDAGEITVLPPSRAREIRNEKRLSFTAFMHQSMHAHIPGFDGFREASGGTNLLQTVLTKDLTKSLNKITEPLATEASLSLEGLLTNGKEFHTVNLQETILRLVARMSSRVFLGTELCRDEAWLRVTREHTVTAFKASEELRMWPKLSRSVVHWFLPGCRELRAQVHEARQIITATLESRREQEAELLAQGKEPPKYNDAIEWFEQTSKGTVLYDPTAMQLVLSAAAIHTTTDLISQVLIRLAQNPDIVESLRAEITAVLQEEGWSKTSLFKMKLLDSVIKESQRMKPIQLVSMTRLALADVKLSDGTLIPKDSSLTVSSHRMWDPEVYDNPDQWDGYRFLKMREDPAKQNSALLVSTGPDFLGFGHGQHACPGRFFAANEAKVAVLSFIMKYDFGLVGDAPPQIVKHGFNLSGDPSIQMRVRRREEEVSM